MAVRLHALTLDEPRAIYGFALRQFQNGSILMISFQENVIRYVRKGCSMLTGREDSTRGLSDGC